MRKVLSFIFMLILLVGFVGCSGYNQAADKAALESAAKTAYVAAQQYLIDNPGGMVDSLDKLKAAGYKPSENIAWVSGSMTLYSGSIKIKSTAPGMAKDTAVIGYAGDIAYL